MLEVLARRKPVIVLIEDLQWAEPTLLDTLESIAESSRESPIMLVCMARPDELYERRKHWPEGRLNATSIFLEPLSKAEGEQLVDHLLESRGLDPDALARITYLAQNYPLIIEEVIATLIERNVLRLQDGRWIGTRDLTDESAPPTIHALLEARLDRLEERDRTVIELAAIVGEQFHDSDIAALSPEIPRAELTARLYALVRKELIQPAHAVAAPLATESGEGFRFRHITMRTVAYERMTESVRGEHHEKFADWLEQTAGERISQFDELMCLHLYQAYRYRQKMGPLDERGLALAVRAGERSAKAAAAARPRGRRPVQGRPEARDEGLRGHHRERDRRGGPELRAQRGAGPAARDRVPGHRGILPAGTRADQAAPPPARETGGSPGPREGVVPAVVRGLGAVQERGGPGEGRPCARARERGRRRTVGGLRDPPAVPEHVLGTGAGRHR